MFRNYKLAGCLAIASALISIPSMILMAIDMFSEDSRLALANAITQTISATVFVLLMLYLRSYLQERLALGKQKVLFGFIIALGILIYGTSISISFLDPFSSIITILASSAPAILLGILLLVVALRIIKTKLPGTGYAKAYAYLVGATGLLNATILFADLAVLLNLASDIIMAVMFFNTAKGTDSTAALPLDSTSVA